MGCFTANTLSVALLRLHSMEGAGECNGANSFNRLFNDLNKKREWKSQRWPSDKLLGLKRI